MGTQYAIGRLNAETGKIEMLDDGQHPDDEVSWGEYRPVLYTSKDVALSQAARRRIVESCGDSPSLLILAIEAYRPVAVDAYDLVGAELAWPSTSADRLGRTLKDLDTRRRDA